MPDTTFGNAVYRKQGAAELVIASGGALTFEAGGGVTGPAEVVAATNAIAAAESGTTFFLNSGTEFVSTLPAPALGLRFTFVVAAAPASASYTIVTNGSANVILGHVLTSQDAGGTADSETSGGDTITFVDAKAVVGDRVDLECDGTSWFARCSSKVFDAITITTAS
jgi:membrane protein implicated in regulation of membrane protease activity